MFYNNKHFEKYNYWPKNFVQLYKRYIKIKKNLKIEYKYFGYFEILEVVKK